MDRIPANVGGEVLEDISAQPILREVRPTQVCSVRRLSQAWELRGGHPTTYRCDDAYKEVCDWRYVQVIAVGHADAAKHLSTRKGPETLLKVVGWARAKVLDTLDTGAAPADIEDVFIDPTVQPLPVHEFLLRTLQKKIMRTRKQVGSLRAEVSGGDIEGARLHWRLGFRETGRAEEFVWYPS